jgi:hypothetical protein
MNDKARMTKRSCRLLFRHLSIRTSFVIRHLCFVILDHSCFVISNWCDLMMRKWRRRRRFPNGNVRRTMMSILSGVVPDDAPKGIRASIETIMRRSENAATAKSRMRRSESAATTGINGAAAKRGGRTRNRSLSGLARCLQSFRKFHYLRSAVARNRGPLPRSATMATQCASGSLSLMEQKQRGRTD